MSFDPNAAVEEIMKENDWPQGVQPDITDDAALEWLSMVAISGWDEKYRAKIKEMIARPTLPEALTDAQRTSIKKALHLATGHYHTASTIDAVFAAIRAELMKPPAPPTKEVDVWHVEWVVETIPQIDDPYLSKDMAERRARLRQEDGIACVRVTGPHKHVVPA